MTILPLTIEKWVSHRLMSITNVKIASKFKRTVSYKNKYTTYL